MATSSRAPGSRTPRLNAGSRGVKTRWVAQLRQRGLDLVELRSYPGPEPAVPVRPLLHAAKDLGVHLLPGEQVQPRQHTAHGGRAKTTALVHNGHGAGK